MGTIVLIAPFCAVEGAIKIARYPLRAKSPTANPVLDTRSHHMGRINVAVDVGFNHSIHPDHAQPADQFGMVRNFLRTKHDAIAEFSDLRVELCPISGLREKAVAEAQVSLPQRNNSIMPS